MADTGNDNDLSTNEIRRNKIKDSRLANRHYYCSFCGVRDNEADQMFDGVTASICRKCVDYIHDLIHSNK